jgi:hypothetical protein
MSVSRNALSPGAGVQAARTLVLLPVKALQTPLGRRIAVAGALIATLQGAVGALYSNADDKPRTAPVAQAAAVAQAPAAVVRPTPAAKPSTARPTTPEAAAVAWYAARHKLAASKVKALQRNAVSSTKARVLVMAEVGRDRLDTAVVTVERDGAGWTKS